MPKTLDFNINRRPTITVKMKDEDQTIFHLTTPTVELVNRIREGLPDLQAVLQTGDAETSRAIYALAADLINCNMDAITVTGEDLAQRYEMNLEDMMVFFSAYLDFLDEVHKLKN